METTDNAPAPIPGKSMLREEQSPWSCEQSAHTKGLAQQLEAGRELRPSRNYPQSTHTIRPWASLQERRKLQRRRHPRVASPIPLATNEGRRRPANREPSQRTHAVRQSWQLQSFYRCAHGCGHDAPDAGRTVTIAGVWKLRRRAEPTPARRGIKRRAKGVLRMRAQVTPALRMAALQQPL